MMKNVKILLMAVTALSMLLVGCGNNSSPVEETTEIIETSAETKSAVRSFERELKVKGETSDSEIVDIFTKGMLALSERNAPATVQYTDIDMIMSSNTGIIFDVASLTAMVQSDFIAFDALYEPLNDINDYVTIRNIAKADGMKNRMQNQIWTSEALQRFADTGQNPNDLFDIQGMYKIELAYTPAYARDYPEKAENIADEWTVYVVNINGEWKLEYATLMLFTTKNFTDFDVNILVGAK